MVGVVRAYPEGAQACLVDERVHEQQRCLDGLLRVSVQPHLEEVSHHLRHLILPYDHRETEVA